MGDCRAISQRQIATESGKMDSKKTQAIRSKKKNAILKFSMASLFFILGSIFS
ncbi:hypothetical protein FEDK69T_20020 [Flavobacterium enshiense DK69]|nr:hypothetical protein FEDK69T_20020 [Flavobacterium enshiense DK69]